MKKTAFQFISAGKPWAITEEWMAEVLAIAERENESPEAISAKMGRPLDNARSVTLRDGVAVTPLQGPIFPKANMMTELSGATSLEMFLQDIMAAEENPMVFAHVIDANSPGGITTAVHEASTYIKALKKPCVAYVSGMAASACYLAIAGCTKIIMDPMALAGSIGVVQSVPPKREDGSVEIVSSQSPDKRPDHTTEAGRAVRQKMVDDMAQIFINTVADYRGLTPEQVAAVRGGMLVGQHAVDAGLANGLGTLESVIADLQAAHSPFTPHNPTRRPAMATTKPDAASLKAEHPDLYQAVLGEGQQLGAKAERERIQAVEAAALPGHEALIASLKFDGKTDGGTAALEVLKAEKEARAKGLGDFRSEAPRAAPSNLPRSATDPQPSQNKQAPESVAELDATAIYAKQAESRAATLAAKQ